jgi:hypothetical protein
MLTRRLTFHRLTRLFLPFSDSYSSIDPVYFPASRTGFMQLYKAAARRSFQDAHRHEEASSDWLDVTTPAFHFLVKKKQGGDSRRRQTSSIRR